MKTKAEQRDNEKQDQEKILKAGRNRENKKVKEQRRQGKEKNRFKKEGKQKRKDRRKGKKRNQQLKEST